MIGPIKGDTRSSDMAAMEGDTRSLDLAALRELVARELGFKLFEPCMNPKGPRIQIIRF